MAAPRCALPTGSSQDSLAYMPVDVRRDTCCSARAFPQSGGRVRLQLLTC